MPIKLFDTTTKLVDKTLQSDRPIVVNQGGTSSSKTWSLLQVCFIKAIEKPGRLITIVGQDMPNLKTGAYRDAKTILYDNEILESNLKFHHKGNYQFLFDNGSIIEFKSYDDAQDAKSGKRDFLFLNEANGISFKIYEELEVRTSAQVYLDFNPTTRFWAHEQLRGRDDVTWITSTYKQNPYLQESIKQKILSYKPTEENIRRGTANEYRWKVYGLGLVGRLEGLVFGNFKETPEWPEEYKWRAFGMDFGFSNDPSTLVEVRYIHGALYCRQWFYKRGMTNNDISRKLSVLGFSQNWKIVADSAEPKSIKELQRDGWYVVGADKGKDSVMHGINLLKEYPIYVYNQSEDLVEEFSSYTWAEDKDGNLTNKPIDRYNHGVDAIRYAVTKKLGMKKLQVMSV